MKGIGFIILGLVLAACAFLGGRASKECAVIVDTRTDTIVRVDTIRDTVLVAIDRFIARIDTVWLPTINPQEPGSYPDSGPLYGDSVHVTVPIERKVYQTSDYRAEIEGFRASLVSMDVYRQTEYITKTERVSMPDTRRWSVGLSVGYGANIQGGNVRLSPYIGVGIHYRLFYLDKKK